MPLTRSEQARLNGAKSKGPTSIQGKLRSSRNSVRHGLVTDKVVVLQNELPDAFDRVYTAFAEKFKPQDDAERELVLQAAAARWRLRRVWQLETTLFDLKMDEQRDLMQETFERFDEHTRQAVAFRSLADDTRSFTLLSRYETRISREYERAIRALDRLRQERENEPEPDPEPPQQKFPNEPKPNLEHPSGAGFQPAEGFQPDWPLPYKASSTERMEPMPFHPPRNQRPSFTLPRAA
jgi:hypothetical protein